MNTVCVETHSNQNVHHIMQQLMIRTEYILRTNQEQQYADFLNELSVEESFEHFSNVINEDIKQFGITDQEIQQVMQSMLVTL